MEKNKLPRPVNKSPAAVTTFASFFCITGKLKIFSRPKAIVKATNGLTIPIQMKFGATYRKKASKLPSAKSVKKISFFPFRRPNQIAKGRDNKNTKKYGQET